MLELVKTEITALVESGILDADAGFDADTHVQIASGEPADEDRET